MYRSRRETVRLVVAPTVASRAALMTSSKAINDTEKIVPAAVFIKRL
jgi:glycerol dehydrogenase-like iron-containing ADH family enzyme